MKVYGFILAVILMTATCFALPQSFTEVDFCQVQDNQEFEWVYFFPQDFQRGQTMVVGEDWLKSQYNLRPGFEEWMRNVAQKLLQSNLVGEKFNEFAVFRHKESGQDVIFTDFSCRQQLSKPETNLQFDKAEAQPSQQQIPHPARLQFYQVGRGGAAGAAFATGDTVSRIAPFFGPVGAIASTVWGVTRMMTGGKKFVRVGEDGTAQVYNKDQVENALRLERALIASGDEDLIQNIQIQ